MSKVPTNKPRLTIAGPGAGKTHKMVDEIIKVLPTLKPHHHLAAITFTNAAADNIRERMQSRAQLARNVFVGTTHMFINRFILSPCATLFEKLPEERIFAAVNLDEKGRGKAIYARNLIRKGVVPFDSMITIARELLKVDGVRERISARLSHVFIDEFQDTDVGTLEIYEQIRIGGKTAIYAVGDPEQFVMGFTFRGMAMPEFDKLPFFRFKHKAISSVQDLNHRSIPEIVDLANRFRTDLQQVPVRPACTGQRVLFLSSQSIRGIVDQFREESGKIVAGGAPLSRLYLASENAAFEDVVEEFGIKPASDRGRRSSSVLSDALELLASALDRGQLKACRDLGLSRLEWRRVGIDTLRMASNPEFNVPALVRFVKERFDHRVSVRGETLGDAIANLKSHLTHGSHAEPSDRFATIRKAKGLEADAVLAMAKGTSELGKWLQTDRQTRSLDKQDTCRIGYVAFTRPREILCVACLKPVDAQMSELLQSLRFHIV